MKKAGRPKLNEVSLFPAIKAIAPDQDSAKGLNRIAVALAPLGVGSVSATRRIVRDLAKAGLLVVREPNPGCAWFEGWAIYAAPQIIDVD